MSADRAFLAFGHRTPQADQQERTCPDTRDVTAHAQVRRPRWRAVADTTLGRRRDRAARPRPRRGARPPGPRRPADRPHTLRGGELLRHHRVRGHGKEQDARGGTRRRGRRPDAGRLHLRSPFRPGDPVAHAVPGAPPPLLHPPRGRPAHADPMGRRHPGGTSRHAGTRPGPPGRHRRPDTDGDHDRRLPSHRPVDRVGGPSPGLRASRVTDPVASRRSAAASGRRRPGQLHRVPRPAGHRADPAPARRTGDRRALRRPDRPASCGGRPARPRRVRRERLPHRDADRPRQVGRAGVDRSTARVPRHRRRSRHRGRPMAGRVVAGDENVAEERLRLPPADRPGSPGRACRTALWLRDALDRGGDGRRCPDRSRTRPPVPQPTGPGVDPPEPLRLPPALAP